MTDRFLGLVGSLPSDEQQLWHPNQLAHDAQSWFDPQLFQLKSEYKHDCKVQKTYIVQDHPPSPSEILLLPPLQSLCKAHARNQELPQPGDARPVMSPSQNALSEQMMKNWEPWEGIHGKGYE